MKSFSLIIFCVLLCKPIIHAEETADSTKVYELPPINVSASREAFGTAEYPVSKDRFINVLHRNGFELIRKGTFFAQDVYVDGFKRADIPVVIDGEQYHSACPNRMDSPITRLNPLEMDIVTMTKENNSLYSSLGGGILLTRNKPQIDRVYRIASSQNVGAADGSDLALSFNQAKHRIDLRYASGSGYNDGDDRSFEELYGYKRDFTYKLAEGVLTGISENITYRGAFTYTENVMFPYLRMDERFNRVFSGSLKYDRYKLYATYTDHLMDNGLRVSTSSMITEARNLTVGLTSDMFELVYRQWDADNVISTPMTTIANHLMPEVHVINGAVFRTWQHNSFTFNSRIGGRFIKPGDSDRLSLHRTLYPDTDNSRFLLSGAVNVGYEKQISSTVRFGLTTDMVAVPPTEEQLYIGVEKPMGKPAWVGNPTLASSVKGSFRLTVEYQDFTVESFAAMVKDYVILENIMVAGSPYLTFANIDASLIGLTARYSGKYVSSTLAYTYGQNRTTDKPLAEIAPFSWNTTFRSPTYKNMTVSVKHTYNDAQTRVDPDLTERKTTSWHRFDLALAYQYKTAMLTFEIDNLSDETYTRHLSYLRDPFNSGMDVYDSGRTFRLTLFYSGK